MGGVLEGFVGRECGGRVSGDFACERKTSRGGCLCHGNRGTMGGVWGGIVVRVWVGRERRVEGEINYAPFIRKSVFAPSPLRAQHMAWNRKQVFVHFRSIEPQTVDVWV